MILSIRTYFEIAAALVLAVCFVLFTFHERAVGQQKIEAANDAASAKATAAAVAETTKLKDQAYTAERQAQYAETKLNDYMAAHPVGTVIVCRTANNSGAGVPAGAPAPGKATDTGTGSSVVSAVPASAPGADLSEGLTELVSSAARLAIIDAERQQRTLTQKEKY